MLKPRKRLVKAKLKEDKLLTYTIKIQEIFNTHWKNATFALVAVIVVVGIALGVGWSKKSKNDQAGFAEMLARDSYMQGKTDDALTQVNEILDKYSNTKSEATALMIKGRIFQQRGEFERAEEAFKEVTKKFSEEPYLVFGAYNSLGSIAYGKALYGEAGELYEKAFKTSSEHFNAPIALLAAGDCYEKNSKYERAKGVYVKILKLFPKSRSADKARNNLAELEFIR